MGPDEHPSEPFAEPGASLVDTAVPQREPAPLRPASLHGKVAIVTGGGWNIGRATSLAIARAGARVIVTSRRRVNLEETVAIGKAEKLDMRLLAGDLTDIGDVDAIFDDIVSHEGQVDILVCLAGGYGAAVPVADSDPTDWFEVFKRNLFATYLCCRRALPSMLQRKHGDILTCAGGGAFFPMVGVHATAYACAKAAICRFTDQLYAEHMDVPGLRVNCFEPGMTLNPDDLTRIEREEAETGKVHPVRELNHPPEAGAELAMFLLSPAARALNGRILSVDEDWWRNPDRVADVVPSDFYRLRRTFLPDA